jgi:hypothetical protein
VQEIPLIAAAIVAAIGLALALVPALAIAAAVGATAWRRGWEPRYLMWHTLWAWVSLPVLGIVLTGFDPLGSVRLYLEAIDAAKEGHYAEAVVRALVWSIPLGWTLALVWWVRWRQAHETGRGVSAERAERHRARQHRFKADRAKTEARTGIWPLTRKGAIVLGPKIEETEEVPGHPLAKMLTRHRRDVTIPWLNLRQHGLFVADPGAGKTVAMTRFSVGATALAWKQHTAGECGRPLPIVINCKDGLMAWDDGFEWTDHMARLGIDRKRMGLWPVDEACRLNLWELPPTDLEGALLELAGGREDTPEHYTALRETMLHLVVAAPQSGPPKHSADFLRRINQEWFTDEWRGNPIELEAIKGFYEGRDQSGRDVLIKYYNLFTKLGTALDGGHSLDDLDALYVAVDGATNPRYAAAQVNAVVRLVKSYLTSPGTDRSVLLFIDEYSAISAEMGRGLLSIFEQFRSLGGSCWAIAQSVQGLGADEGEQRRLIAACSGGRVIMRSTDAGLLCELSGTRKRPEVSNVVTSTGRVTGEASLRIQDTFVVDPQKVRQMAPGEFYFAHGGKAERGIVVPLQKGTVDEFEVRPAIEARHVAPLGASIAVRELLEARRLAIGAAPTRRPDEDDDDFGIGDLGTEVL